MGHKLIIIIRLQIKYFYMMDCENISVIRPLNVSPPSSPSIDFMLNTSGNSFEFSSTPTTPRTPFSEYRKANSEVLIHFTFLTMSDVLNR